jgi:hypothetical protein
MKCLEEEKDERIKKRIVLMRMLCVKGTQNLWVRKELLK